MAMRWPSLRRSPGFTLIETLIATCILVTVFTGIAGLLVSSMRFARESGRHGSAMLVAQAKLEWLRAKEYAYGPEGDRVTDVALSPSPPGALGHDTSGYQDALDADGSVVDAADGPNAGPAWVRRWAVTSMDAGVPDAVAIEVCVYHWPAHDVSPGAADACLSTIRVRQP